MKTKRYLLFPLVISGFLALSILISVLGVGQEKRSDGKGAQEATKETAKEEADLTFVKSIITASLKDEKKQTDSKVDTDPKISSAAENTWGLEKTAESEVAAELGDMTIVKQTKNKKKKQKKEVKSYETVNPTDQ